ncbi:MAG TPA: hypothetical protein V6C99_10755 [Oculatellaceae cyanobacterium]
MEELSVKDLERLLKEKKKAEKGGRFSKFIVSLVILLNIAFTVAVLFIFYRIGVEPTALIAAWFGFTTAELWALAGIKKKEIDRQNDREGM